jgi:hypothetical protein
MIVYRIQDKHGRGPFKPGFSGKWVLGRPDHDNLFPWTVEFGMVHQNAYKHEHIGCGCKTIEQLKRWFTEPEYFTLINYGYDSVEIKPDRILAKSDIQIVFTRNKPLNEQITKFKLY